MPTQTALHNKTFLLLGAVLLAGLLLRLPFLGSMSLCLDEMWSIGTSRMPWASVLWVVFHQDSNASLYYALLHAWMRLGNSEATVRLLSVLLGLATIPPLYMLGKRLVNAQVGLMASLLIAVNGFHIRFSQEARAYSLVVLLITLSSLFFVKSVEQPTARNWCAYVLTSVLAVYVHAFAGLVLASHWVSLLFLPKRERRWRRVVTSFATIGVLVIPLGILLFARMREPMAPLAWVPKPTWRDIAGLFWLLAGNISSVTSPSSPRPTFREALPGAPLLISYFVACFVMLVCSVKVWRSGRSCAAWRSGVPFAWLLVPIAVAVAVSIVKPIFVSKYLLVCLPGLALLVAIGLDSMPRWTAATAVVGIVILSLYALPTYYQFRSRNHEWRMATDCLLTQARPGDSIIFFVAPGRLLFDYYRERYNGWINTAGQDIEVTYPAFGDENHDPNVLAYMPPPPANLFTSGALHNHRIWLVLFHDNFSFTSELRQHIMASLAASYRKAQENEFHGYGERVALVLYVSNDTQVHSRNSAIQVAPYAQ
jgi:4-amino-4-deoxy-L-arabinose transferase-like glycosyltransferase